MMLTIDYESLFVVDRKLEIFICVEFGCSSSVPHSSSQSNIPPQQSTFVSEAGPCDMTDAEGDWGE